MKVVSFDVGTKNLAYCLIEGHNIISWKVIDIQYRNNEDLCNRVVATLDQNPEVLDADVALIEKQPSKNNKMRIVEALLNAYFVIKGVNSDSSNIAKSVVYSSKHKLGDTNLRGKPNYRERKKLGMTRCEQFLKQTEQPDDIQTLYQMSKKKDDLADSLLQALSYVKDDTIKEIEGLDLDTSSTISARKPTKKQESKMYSKSNLKYIFMNHSEKTINGLSQLQNTNPKIKRAVSHWYQHGGIEKAMREFNIDQI